MKNSFLVTLVMVMPMTLATAASADVLLVEEVRQVEKMNLPKNGLSKSDVESRFGEPVQRHSAVGDPPITRWDYDTYSVYFEYDLVLFSVLRSGQPVDSA